MEIILRECTQYDLEAVMQLQVKWELENITRGFIAADETYLIEKLGPYFYVVEVENEVVGFVYASVKQSTENDVAKDCTYVIEVNDLYIEQNHRKLGLGGALLDKVLDVAKSNGIERSLICSSSTEIQIIR